MTWEPTWEMEPQTFDWTCSICTYTWCIQATNTDPYLTREVAATIIGYPNCVNELYGLMSSQCLINAFAHYGLHAVEAWPTYDQALYLASHYTGGISPAGMYHWMAIRGTSNGDLWVANSAPGYKNVWESLSRDQYNALGPTKLVYLDSYLG